MHQFHNILADQIKDEGNYQSFNGFGSIHEAVQMFRDAAEQEKEWAKYLFEHGQMIGLNANVLSDYVDHLTYKRMRGVGLPPIVRSQRNPLGWMEKWLNSKGIQEAPQETEKESYMIGAVDSDVGDDDLDDLSL